MDLIHDYMCRGAMIKWVGYNGPRMVEVHMFHNEDVVIETIQLEKDYTDETFEKLFSSSASEPGSVTGTIWSSDNRLELLRLASILGLNPGAQAIPGAGQAFRGKLGCVMAYDIEQDRTRLSNSSFPTPSESITCIATYCSCGETRLFSFIQGVDFDYTQCSSSQETVSHFIDYVTVHSPQWLVGYNNFRYDNTCIAFHANKRYDNIFVSMRVGAGSSLSYAFYLDIPGVYNIDLLTYLDKTRRGTYTNMSLATLVKHHGIDEKITYDTADYTDLVKLFEYNLHDSMITMKLAFETNSIVEITTLAVVTCSPIIDCVRFVSGTLAACSVASYCLANKIRMDWSPCLEVMEYRGAEVLKPVIGLHENVVLCDFSSMYPTVLMGSNISIENQSEVSSSSPSGAVSITENSSVFTIGSKDISFCSKTKCIMPPVMKLFVDKRRMVRKSNPSYALALKVAANSIYGSLGDRHSRIYSPNCSAAVTTGGRWCLATAEMILKMMGYAVVYGDTDSCFIAPTEKIRTDVNTATAVLSRIFLFSPFPGMSMEVENTYSKIAFLGKKTYFGKTTDGKIVSKGMSRSRKDRIGICRTLSALVVPTILSDMPIADRRRTIGDMLSLSVDYVVTNSLSLQQVSKIVKRGGTNYYEYRTDTDQRDWRDCESCTGLEMVPYSAGRVVKSIRSEIESILAITKLGNMATMMRSSDII